MILQRIKNMKGSDFIRSLTVLMTGTLIAQFVGYALAPIISRQFSPAEMGEFANEMKALGIKAIGSCCGSTPEHTAAIAQAF